MTLRQRLPYIIILAGTALTQVASGVLRLIDGEPLWTATGLFALAVPLAVAAIALALARPPLAVPVWSRIFELLRTGRGVVVRCIECDDLVIVGSAAPLMMSRVLTYMHAHYGSELCRDRQRERAALLRLSAAAGEETTG